MVNIYCRGKQPHGLARGPARRCQGAGRPGCCPEAATLTGALGDRRPGPGLGLPVGHTPAPRSAWAGAHGAVPQQVPASSRGARAHGAGEQLPPPPPSAGAGTWVPTQGWTRSHGRVEPSPRADRV